MQKQSDRVLQKNNTMARSSHPISANPLNDAEMWLRKWQASQPSLTSAQVAESAIEQYPETANSIAPILVRAFYLRIVVSERRKEGRASRNQLRLPGFEHLPFQIPDSKGKPVPILDADLRCVRAYYRSLVRSQEARQKRDLRTQELRELLDKMRKYSGTEKGITVRQVLALEAD